MKFSLTTIFCILFITGTCFDANAQKDTVSSISDPHTASILTADSLSSGNYKDVLNSFFQLAINNLTGPNKELNFVTTPYAVMVRANSALAYDNNYVKTAWARRFNIAINARLDSSYKFNGFATGITYAIINRRDFSLRKKFVEDLKSSPDISKNQRLNSFLSSNTNSNYKVWDIFDTIIRKSVAKEINTKYPKLSIDQIDNISFKYRQKEDSLNNVIPKLIRNAPVENNANIDIGMTAAERQKMERESVQDKEPDIVSPQTLRNNLLFGIANSDSSLYPAVKDFDSIYRIKRASLRKYVIGAIPTFTNDTASASYKSISDTLQQFIQFFKDNEYVMYLNQKLGEDPNFSFGKFRQNAYDSIVASYATKPLWTFTISDTSYSNGKLFKNVKMSSEFLWGLNKEYRIFNPEFDTKVYYTFGKDSLNTEGDLSRQILNIEPGINFVLRSKDSKQSYFEFKLGGAINHIFSGRYTDEDKTLVTINGTIRFRIFDDIWIPIDIKYDPKTGNVFGFLNVKANFKALGSLFSK